MGSQTWTEVLSRKRRVRNGSRGAGMVFPKHCDVSATECSPVPSASAPIAPAALHSVDGRRRTDPPSIPPSAATGMPASRASRDQRSGPSPAASGWLAVGKQGDRNASAAPARRARTRSPPSWAELVTSPHRGRSTPGQWPARRCTPARSAAASLTSPATTSKSRRARQSRARSTPSCARSAAASCRSTTPAKPFGRCATAGRGSGSRAASVNSQSGGSEGPCLRRWRAAAARAQAANRLSITRRTLPFRRPPKGPGPFCRMSDCSKTDIAPVS